MIRNYSPTLTLKIMDFTWIWGGCKALGLEPNSKRCDKMHLRNVIPAIPFQVGQFFSYQQKLHCIKTPTLFIILSSFIYIEKGCTHLRHVHLNEFRKKKKTRPHWHVQKSSIICCRQGRISLFFHELLDTLALLYIPSFIMYKLV